MFSCGQSDLWALITGLGLREGWHLCQPRSCPPAGGILPLCASSGPFSLRQHEWGRSLPHCLGRPSYWFHLGRAESARAAAGQCTAKCTGAGRELLLPTGSVHGTLVSAGVSQCKRPGGSSTINPPTSRAFLHANSIQLENTEQGRLLLTAVTEGIKTRQQTREGTFKCLERTNQPAISATEGHKRLP